MTQLIKIIDPTGKKETRIVQFEGNYELGYDKEGRHCRVAQHKGLSGQILRPGCAIRTGGNVYVRPLENGTFPKLVNFPNE